VREYGKVSPQFWIGRTGKALRGNPDAQIVALYLMTSPHANMIGVFHCPIAYIAHETGLTIEGASKGLRSLIEADFCTYDDDAEYVCVHEFAAYQVGDSLDPLDKRCKGVENELAKVPKGPCHQAFRARYAVPFNLPIPTEAGKPPRSPSKAPSMPEAGAGARTEDKPPIPPKGGKSIGLSAWLAERKAAGESPVPDDDSVFEYASGIGLPHEFLHLAWLEFRHRYSQPDAKKYKDWRAVFRRAVRGNWLKLWYLDGTNAYGLTTVGMQAQRAHTERAAA
jgi:hypothetical protein